MRLDNVIDGLADDAGSLRVTGFAIDHRKVAQGTVFGAFPTLFACNFVFSITLTGLILPVLPATYPQA